MSLDVYVGTMSRFYGLEWENSGQKMARELDINYTKVHPTEAPDPSLSADELRPTVARWCSELSLSLQPQGIGPIGWGEDEEKPYFTECLTWAGYRSLLLWAAYAEHPALPMPTQVPETWHDNLAFLRSTAPDFKSRYRTILEPELWLPTQFPFVFEATALSSEKVCIGSVFTLKQQLDDLQLQTKNRFQKLRKSPARFGFLKSLFRSPTARPEPAEPSLVELAEFGLSVFRELAEKACEHRLPMLLDY